MPSATATTSRKRLQTLFGTVRSAVSGFVRRVGSTLSARRTRRRGYLPQTNVKASPAKERILSPPKRNPANQAAYEARLAKLQTRKQRTSATSPPPRTRFPKAEQRKTNLRKWTLKARAEKERKATATPSSPSVKDITVRQIALMSHAKFLQFLRSLSPGDKETLFHMIVNHTFGGVRFGQLLLDEIDHPDKYQHLYRVLRPDQQMILERLTERFTAFDETE